jgi:hypothetical protein
MTTDSHQAEPGDELSDLPGEEAGFLELPATLTSGHTSRDHQPVAVVHVFFDLGELVSMDSQLKARLLRALQHG